MGADDQIFLTLSIALILILSMMALIMFRYIGVMRRYQRQIIRYYDEIIKGNYQVRISTITRGDVGKLMQSFHIIIREINAKIETLGGINANLKAVLEGISTGVIAIDNNEKIILINKKAQELLYQNSQEQRDSFLTEGIRSPEMLKKLRELIYEEKQQEEKYYFQGGFYSFQTGLIQLSDARCLPIGHVIVIEDITQRVNLENIRNEFVTNVTHELKTPLTSIAGFVETLQRKEDMPKETRMKFLGIIEEETQRLKRMIDDVLLLSFADSAPKIDKEEWDLTHILDQVIKVMEPIAVEKQIELLRLYPSKGICLRTRGESIRHIAINFIDNAIKYSPPQKKVWITLQESEQNIQLIVKDEGDGISPEDQKRIFDRFYRGNTPWVRKGSGLGLAIVHRMAEDLDGQVIMESQEGQGSTFTVILPKLEIEEEGEWHETV